ncbi:TPA: adenylate/guanylate cyclase domain-containing protein [Legionella feeleii]|uniref:Guanylate cyclase n=1 Tax=Legionella feeleii TaxID=453 RepID=A0A378IWM2_9GAMM|nr:adenylate/guanylate cyclase domain-containing protein [Legionella feeleii]STX39322.1 guanylate cyclase [Legionella feeleii]
MIQKSNLYLFTFLGIFFSLFLVGTLLSPLLLNMIRSTYLTMSMDVNRRQAQVVAQMISHLLTDGEPKKNIISALQASLAKTEMDRGYLCLIDENTGVFLAHPIKKFVGQNVHQFNTNFLSLGQEQPQKWGTAIQNKKVEAGGTLIMPGGRTEIVNSFLVPDTSVRVFSHENMKRLNREIAKLQQLFIIIFILLGFIVAFPASYAALKVSRRYEKRIEAEQEKSERLLLNILPGSIAQRLKSEETNIANRYEDVSVLFIDMVNFTSLSAAMSPEKLVELLNFIFSRFDEISLKYGLEKIKTMGDSYMVAGGIPEFKPDHLKCCVEAGMEMMAFINKEHLDERKFTIRAGLHVGPVVAGVIGTHKFTYDLWGETVNIASRLESTSVPGHIQCSHAVYERIKNDYRLLPRGEVLLKGMGTIPTYFLLPQDESN